MSCEIKEEVVLTISWEPAPEDRCAEDGHLRTCRRQAGLQRRWIPHRTPYVSTYREEHEDVIQWTVDSEEMSSSLRSVLLYD